MTLLVMWLCLKTFFASSLFFLVKFCNNTFILRLVTLLANPFSLSFYCVNPLHLCNRMAFPAAAAPAVLMSSSSVLILLIWGWGGVGGNLWKRGRSGGESICNIAKSYFLFLLTKSVCCLFFLLILLFLLLCVFVLMLFLKFLTLI